MLRPSDVRTVSKLTGEQDEELIAVLLDDAESFVLAYTMRTKIIQPLEKPVRDLAVIALNRMGTEGENSRSEGGETYNFNDAPKQIFDTLNRYRICRVGGTCTVQHWEICLPGTQTRKSVTLLSFIITVHLPIQDLLPP